MRCSISLNSNATSRSRCSISSSMVFSTLRLCRARTRKCSPLGPYWPENRFLTVRSFAPVHRATVLIRSPFVGRCPLQSRGYFHCESICATFQRICALPSRERTCPFLESSFRRLVAGLLSSVDGQSRSPSPKPSKLRSRKSDADNLSRAPFLQKRHTEGPMRAGGPRS
jgi:hypothetical protein